MEPDQMALDPRCLKNSKEDESGFSMARVNTISK